MVRVFARSNIVALDGVDIDVGANTVTMSARRELRGISTGRFASPSCGVSWSRSKLPHDIEILGFAFTQFALPVTAGADLAFDFGPAPGLRSPRAVSPLIARAGGAVSMVAPIDHFHEQIVAISDDAIVCGWHGDLDEVPAGFTTRFGIYVAATVGEVLDAWHLDLAIDPDLDRPTDNPLSTHLSYWTDNGAAYWYRTEADRTIAESVVDVVETLRADDVPGPIRRTRFVVLSARHAAARSPRSATRGGPADRDVDLDGRVDAYPLVRSTAAIRSSGSRTRSAASPLTLHARHIAPTSPYITDPTEWWVDEFAAHPIDPSFFRRWFDDAQRWGATVIEQDWMLMYWFGVRQLRAAPDRAADWQQGAQRTRRCDRRRPALVHGDTGRSDARRLARSGDRRADL